MEENKENQGFSFNGKTIITQKMLCPLKWIIYGSNGMGKSQLLSQSRNPISIDTEGNANHLDLPRYRVESFDELVSFLMYLLKDTHPYKTIGMDSLDGIEIITSDKIDKSKEDTTWGKGKAIWTRYVKILTDLIDEIQKKRGMNFIGTAHVKIKTENNPLTEPYDKYDITINEAMKTGFGNWANCILFATKEVIIDEDNPGSFGKKKAKNIERRVLYTHGGPTYYGKNTFNLPERILFEGKNGYEEITKHIMNYYGITNNQGEEKQ